MVWKIVYEAGKWIVKRVLSKRNPPKPRTKKPNHGKRKCTSGCNQLAKKAVRPNRRHDLCGTKGGDVSKKAGNSMLDNSVDVAQDMSDLNAGNFIKSGQDLIVNGRAYGQHPDTGVTFPKSGPGIHQFDAAEHKYLKMLNGRGLEGARKFGENTLTGEKMRRVQQLWEQCKK